MDVHYSDSKNSFSRSSSTGSNPGFLGIRSFSMQNRLNNKYIDNTKHEFLILLIYNSARFSWIPGSESTHLDLEKLFLLSDSMEKLNVNGKVKNLEPGKKIRRACAQRARSWTLTPFSHYTSIPTSLCTLYTVYPYTLVPCILCTVTFTHCILYPCTLYTV